MAGVIVDSNILLDVMTEDALWFDWSSQALAALADRERIVINPVIFAEVSVRFSRLEDLEAALDPDLITREAIPYEAAFLAGKAFLRYRREGGAKTSPLPDFLIGAHARVAGYRILTRDIRRYRTYFPTVPLICPDNL